MTQVLAGIKVIDLSQVAAVPICARHLADFGADVIHIENPKTGDSWRSLQAGQGGNAGIPSEIPYNWENYNRNKRSMTLNLADEEGRRVLYDLIKDADVFVTNLRQYEIKKFKVDYETLKRINPRLIYGALTGFGKKGPDKDMPAYDTTSYWARSGLPYVLTAPGMAGPVFRTAIGDNVAGLALVYGVMMALYHREKTGQAQEIDVALLHAGYYQITFDIACTLATGKDNVSIGQAYQWLAPEKMRIRDEMVEDIQKAYRKYQEFMKENAPNPLAIPYETKDGRNLLFAALHPDRYWGDLCRAIGRPELEKDPKFYNTEARAANRYELYHLLKEVFRTRTLAEWKPLVNFIPSATYQTLLEAVNDPQARANDMFVKTPHPVHGELEVLANPVNMSETPATYRLPAPEFNQHTEEILLEMGYDWERIADLKEKGVIA